MLIKLFFAFCLTSVLGHNMAPAAGNIMFTMSHCVPEWGAFGAIRFDIDTIYNKGPFSIRLVKPDGQAEEMADFRGNSHVYERLSPGKYCLTITRQCCNCVAEGCLEVKSYAPSLIGDVSVIWTKENMLAEVDSTAILLACTEAELDGNDLCSAVFSLYSPMPMPSDQIQSMLEKAVLNMKRIKSEGYTELQENESDAWISEPFEVLFGFDEQGELKWVYSEW